MIDLDAMNADPWQTWPVDKQDLRGLVDEIERLRAEIARKDAALTAIAEYDTDAEGNWGFFRDEADAALNPKEPTHD